MRYATIEWVKTVEREPWEGKQMLIYIPSKERNDMQVATYDEAGYFMVSTKWYRKELVSHWAYLPERPS
jgi:hypothetical protein